MKVLFLDIDGVLNSHRSYVANNFKEVEFDPSDTGFIARSRHLNKMTIDPLCVKLLDILCEELDFKIVLSSSHRNLVVDSNQPEHINIERVQEYLKYLGVESPVIGYTPFVGNVESRGVRRGLEVNEWLIKNSVNQYVIVDDANQFLPSQQPFFSYCDPANGFNITNMVEIKKMFGIDWYPSVFL